MSANTAVIEELHQAIVEQRNMEELEGLLWAGVLAYQGKTFYTLSGLEFSYMTPFHTCPLPDPLITGLNKTGDLVIIHDSLWNTGSRSPDDTG